MKKKQIKTGVEILISILGLLALYWIDLYAIKIQFSEHLNKFVTVHDEVWPALCPGGRGRYVRFLPFERTFLQEAAERGV